MAQLNFPSSPTEGQTYNFNGTSWIFLDGSWKRQDLSSVALDSTLTTTSQTAVDSFPHASYSVSEYVIHGTQNSDNFVLKILLNTDGTTATITQYAEVGSVVGTFDADVSGSDARLLYTPASVSSIQLRGFIKRI